MKKSFIYNNNKEIIFKGKLNIFDSINILGEINIFKDFLV